MIAALIVASVLAGTGLGLATSQEGGFGGITTTITQTAMLSGQNASAPYVLTLIITTDNRFNSTIGDQPAYYVLGSNGLESAANITLPGTSLDRAGNLELR